MNTANVVSVCRILLVPVFATLFLYERHNLALTVFVVAGLTDAVDGCLARWRNQRTKLGELLDPMADKILLITAFALLFHCRQVPVWCLILVSSRELVVVGGWIIRHMVTKSSVVASSALGKVATLTQYFAVTALLLSL